MSEMGVVSDESLRTTRSCTIFHALLRLFGTGNVPSHLVLHVVGADHREGTTPEETRSVFAELFQLLGRDERVRDLDLLFCGPNIALRLHDTLHSSPFHFHTPIEKGQDVSTPHTNRGADADGGGVQTSTSLPPPPPPPPPARTLAVKLRYDSGLYHDVSGLYPAPDALFLFNAGLWGYDDWEPTLEHILGCRGNNCRGNGSATGDHDCRDNGDGSRPPVVVTSYCPEEASDDMETIERVVSVGDERRKCLGVGGLEWLWRPEVNPHRSLVPRRTKCGVEGRVLFENQSWQALRRSRGKGALPRVAAET